MAFDDQMVNSADSATSSSSSSSSSSVSMSPTHLRHERLVQVATTNSSTFITFPSNRRQSTSIVPMFRAFTRMSSPMTDTYSSSNHSAKLSPNEQSRSQSQQRFNPILNNPLLNHRKEQVKFPPMKPKSRSIISTQPLKTLFDGQRRASAAPVLPSSDVRKETTVPYLDEVKFDYITRWLEQIRLATNSIEAKV